MSGAYSDTCWPRRFAAAPRILVVMAVPGLDPGLDPGIDPAIHAPPTPRRVGHVLLWQ